MASDRQEWVSNHECKSNPNATQTQTLTLTNSQLLIMVHLSNMV